MCLTRAIVRGYQDGSYRQQDLHWNIAAELSILLSLNAGINSFVQYLRSTETYKLLKSLKLAAIVQMAGYFKSFQSWDVMDRFKQFANKLGIKTKTMC